MSSLTSIEKRAFEDLLGLPSGYVLGDAYSNTTFAELFRECVRVDIYDDKYAFNGDSKAKRLRAFWEIEADPLVGKLLASLLEVWEYKNPDPNAEDSARYKKAMASVNRLLGQTIHDEENADSEGAFLKQQFSKIDLSRLELDAALAPVVKGRLDEAQKCLNADAPLAVIFLAGSILEGILLVVASKNARIFNQAKSSPKDEEGKVRKFPDWSLAQLINTAHETGFLKLDVKKFSHALRDFRNYIHPYQQSISGFQPTKHTAVICLQVLKAAIADLCGAR